MSAHFGRWEGLREGEAERERLEVALEAARGRAEHYQRLWVRAEATAAQLRVNIEQLKSELDWRDCDLLELP